MLIIFLEIVRNWLLMGLMMCGVLTFGLYLAIFCEKIADYFIPTK